MGGQKNQSNSTETKPEMTAPILDRFPPVLPPVAECDTTCAKHQQAFLNDCMLGIFHDCVLTKQDYPQLTHSKTERCFWAFLMQYLNTLKPLNTVSFHDGSLKSKNMNHHKDSVVLFSHKILKDSSGKKYCLLVIITHKHVYFTGNNLHRNNYSTHTKYEAAFFFIAFQVTTVISCVTQITMAQD